MTAPTMVVKDIPMVGWYKVKLVELNAFTYAAGGFDAPFKSKAVLAINADSPISGCVYVDTSTKKQKVKLYSGTSEVSAGAITASIYLLVE